MQPPGRGLEQGHLPLQVSLRGPKLLVGGDEVGVLSCEPTARKSQKKGPGCVDMKKITFFYHFPI